MHSKISRLLISLFFIFSTSAIAQEKHVEDPTRIVTKAGIGYNGEFSFNASIGLDDIRMISGSINETADDWWVSGSWLFEKGIVNFYFNGDDGRKSYSVGTYLPLSAFGIETGQWIVFPMAGASIVDGGRANSNNYGGYLGAFAIRPLSMDWSFVTFSAGTLASGSYTSFSVGAGASYRLNDKNSLLLMTSYNKDDYSSSDNVSISYSYEF